MLDAALDRRFVLQPVFNYVRVRTDAELAQAVRESTIISTWPQLCKPFRLPTANFWASEVAHVRGQIEYLQGLGDEDKRQMAMRALAARLVNAEQELGDDPRSGALPTYILPRPRPRIVENFPADQVVVVRGRARLFLLLKDLAEIGQCIPLPRLEDRNCYFSGGSFGLTIAQAIGLNLPHALEAEHGNWRDWILGMTVVLADGTIVRSGSRVVKNVAGYDAHKLFVGARGTLGIITEVVLRTFPLASLGVPTAHMHFEIEGSGEDYLRRSSEMKRKPIWIQRTRPSDFGQAMAAAGQSLLEHDPETSTLWTELPESKDLPRYDGDWVIRGNCGAKNLSITDPVQILLMRRAKGVFDPTNKLNPGEMGVV